MHITGGLYIGGIIGFFIIGIFLYYQDWLPESLIDIIDSLEGGWLLAFLCLSIAWPYTIVGLAVWITIVQLNAVGRFIQRKKPKRSPPHII